MPWATVPETPIHEDSEPLPTKDEVRLPEQPLMASPSGDPTLAEESG